MRSNLGDGVDGDLGLRGEEGHEALEPQRGELSVFLIDAHHVVHRRGHDGELQRGKIT